MRSAPGARRGRAVANGPQTGALEHQASAAAWIDAPELAREALEAVARRAHLPLELVTYCLLRQCTPTVVPCGAWLYCSWQVPAYRRAERRNGGEISLHVEEVKVCLGPRVIVTAHDGGRRSRIHLASLLPEGSALARERPSNLVVTLIEGMSESYASAYELLATGKQDPPSRRHDRGGAHAKAGLRLLRRHLHAHLVAVEELGRQGRRWLDSGELDRLRAVASRLDAMAIDPSPMPSARQVVRRLRRRAEGSAGRRGTDPQEQKTGRTCIRAAKEDQCRRPAFKS